MARGDAATRRASCQTRHSSRRPQHFSPVHSGGPRGAAVSPPHLGPQEVGQPNFARCEERSPTLVPPLLLDAVGIIIEIKRIALRARGSTEVGARTPRRRSPPRSRTSPPGCEYSQMSVTVVLEWTFAPSDYFEAPFEVDCDGYTITIGYGKVAARISAEVFDESPSIRQDMHDEVNNRFLAVELLNHRPYELLPSSMTRVHADGRRDLFLECEPGHITVHGAPIDITITNKYGVVITDTRKERIERKREFAERIAIVASTDRLCKSLLEIYDRAVRDPNNELVRLYEIRDALAEAYQGDRSALGISETRWSKFGRLCNDAPLRQGRHRGKNVGKLRDATSAELEEARSIARELIEAHLMKSVT